MAEKWNELTLIKKIIICLLAIIVTVVIAAIYYGVTGTVENEKNRINEGTVIDKKYHAPFTIPSYIYINETMIPQNVYYPESYKLKIQREKSEETVEYWFECTSEEYQQYKIGDYYKK